MKEDGLLMHKTRIYVPSSREHRNLVLKEMHNVPYVWHLGYQKTIAPVRRQLFWQGMKEYVVDYISRCMECQRVKAQHRHPVDLLQPLPIPEKKWKVVTIDFITKLPMKTRQHDSIMFVVDKLTKAAHFVPLKMTHTTTNIAEINIREIVRLHEIPKTIVLDRDTNFTSNFWRGLFVGFGTNMNFNTAYHRQSYGKIERVNRVIEDMFRMYVMDNPSKWEDHLHLVEFAYNNGYQDSLKMIPFEAFYGRKHNNLVSWANPTDRVVLGLEFLKDMKD
jgi:hypothetical protein